MIFVCCHKNCIARKFNHFNVVARELSRDLNIPIFDRSMLMARELHTLIFGRSMLLARELP